MSARLANALALLGLGALCLALFGDLLLAARDVVPSHRDADVAYYFAHIRRFAFAELARGNLPLWNPHVFSGQPLLGAFQAGLLYPPNLIYLALPLAKAISLDVTLHVFGIGCFTFAWARDRSLAPLAAFGAGAVAMLAGPSSLRVMAGAVSLVAAMAWAPLVLAAVDRLCERPSLGAALVGIAAATLQILAGYPACAYATAVASALLAALRFRRAPRRARSAVGLAAVAGAPLLLAAAQLWTGLHTASESARAGGVTFDFASSFSLPPANLMAAVLPGFFGDLVSAPYWGPSWYWDASIYLGLVPVTLAALGLLAGRREHRLVYAALALGLLLVALGHHTPLYRALHAWVPGFDRFRGPSKFAFQMSLAVAMLAGLGIDRLLREARPARAAAVALTGLAGLLLLAALWIRSQLASPGTGAWVGFVGSLADPRHVGELDSLTGPAGDRAIRALATACIFAALAAFGLALRARSRVAVPLLVGLATLELLAFARDHRGGFSLSELQRPALESFYAEHPGDHRVLDPAGLDHAVAAGVYSLWGYDPVQLRRYATLMVATQRGADADFENALPLRASPRRPHPLLAMLRGRYLVRGMRIQRPPLELPDPLPRFLVLHRYRVLPEAELPRALLDPAFDPRRELLLEEPPRPPPEPARGDERVALVDESTDHLTLDVELGAAGILLITDAYSAGWRASLESGPERELRVLPANLALRAIPLPGGRHRLRIEYAPLPFRVGRWVSLVATAGFVALVALWARRRSSA